MELPVYKLVINPDDETGVDFVSLVTSPAIERDFVYFNEQKFVEPRAGESEDDFIGRCVPAVMAEGKDQDQALAICYTYYKGKLNKAKKFEAKFEIQNEEKRIIFGMAMEADKKIYRYDEARGEYYVYFDKQTIFEIAKKWAKGDKYDSVNTHHNAETKGLSLFESYIVDREMGKMPPKGYEEVADGSWFLSYIVNDDEIWAKVKEGEFKGFSVEGYFDFEESAEEQQLNAIMNALKKAVEKWNGKN